MIRDGRKSLHVFTQCKLKRPMIDQHPTSKE